MLVCMVLLSLGIVAFSDVTGTEGDTKTNTTISQVVPGVFSRNGLEKMAGLYLPLQSRTEEKASPAEIPELLRRPEPEPILPAIKYANMVLPLSEKHGVDWRLVSAVMEAESNFNSRAISNKGAVGLMQLMPTTAAIYKVRGKDLYDPYKNIEAGVQHLRMLSDRYNGNLEMAVAAYNIGEGVVDRYKGVPPNPTTKYFVRKVMSRYNSHVADASAVGSAQTGGGELLPVPAVR